VPQLRGKFFVALAILALLVGLAVTWLAGSVLIAPSQSIVGPPPPDLHVQDVDWTSRHGRQVFGWFGRGDPGQGAIVLLHGLRADRRSMIGRARFLKRAGYGVLLVDLAAHGENAAPHITFGLREARDVTAAIEFLKTHLPGEPIGIIGASLGGAASLLGDRDHPVAALVLEAVYTTIEEAVENRLAIRFGPVGRYLSPLLLWQMKFLLGIDPERLSPLRGIARVSSPVLFIAGGEDRHTTSAQSRTLYEHAQDPKSLWIIDGAGHLNFHQFAGSDYENRVLRFFKTHLR
jgi:pimeloyl-ACP methyl ester carboxylesterase